MRSPAVRSGSRSHSATGSIAADQRYLFIAVILFGSLLEAAYMFRWFGHAIHGDTRVEPLPGSAAGLVPIYLMAAMLLAGGCATAHFVGTDAVWVGLPLAAVFDDVTPEDTLVRWRVVDRAGANDAGAQHGRRGPHG